MVNFLLLPSIHLTPKGCPFTSLQAETLVARARSVRLRGSLQTDSLWYKISTADVMSPKSHLQKKCIGITRVCRYCVGASGSARPELEFLQHTEGRFPNRDFNVNAK